MPTFDNLWRGRGAHVDPDQAGHERWWDGARWTEHRRAPQAAPAPAEQVVKVDHVTTYAPGEIDFFKAAQESAGCTFMVGVALSVGPFWVLGYMVNTQFTGHRNT
jgi:hypothetical protein